MKIKEEHKALLKKMGLREEEFSLFDGEKVSYEFDPEKGVRIYDPYNYTSYKGYIDIDGWSTWSSEDTFMDDIKEVLEDKLKESELSSQKKQKIFEEHLKKRFRTK